ncbi:MAG: hypothetical protein WBE52_12285, partial [Terriglobales bacterium]
PIPWGGGCQQLKMDHGTLSAVCLNYFGAEQNASLADADKCTDATHAIWDVNGFLRCVDVSLVENIGGSNPYKAHIISISSDVKTDKDETKVIRIDQPRVDVPTEDYQSITFRPGDTIVLSAGGCVQSGGMGLTWKSYITSQGGSAETYYSGTALVPGVIPEGRLRGLINKTWPVPDSKDPALQKKYFLTLGYQDEPGDYSDNGYYGHDNGNNNQCANVGPAWLEVKIVSKLGGSPSSTAVVWSPHSKPFDLTWDVNNEDFNGLPLNPKWNYQFTSGLPNFQSICGPAISGGDNFNIDTLSRDCTSQAPTADVDTSAFVGFGGYCSGLINGHLNWYIATYTGTIHWQDWSGDINVIEPWNSGDGDYNLLLDSPDQNGFTMLNWATAGEYGMGLEFKGGETLNKTGGPWWQQLQRGAENNGTPNPVDIFNDNVSEDGGLLGVVTGTIGIDGVHGGYAESHAVFAIALRTQANQVNDGVQETWVFFLRNTGGEGQCSEETQSWPSFLNNEYFIQLPWWPGATDVKVVGNSDWWAWQDGDTKGSILRSSDPGWTLIKVQFPSDGQYGVDGQFTLQYTVPGGGIDQKKHEPARLRKEEREVFLADAGSRLTNPTVKTKFTADLLDAIKPLSINPPIKRVRITVDASAKVEPRTPGAASRGEGTRPRTFPDPVKKQVNAAIKKVMDTYGPQMQVAPAVKK